MKRLLIFLLLTYVMSTVYDMTWAQVQDDYFEVIVSKGDNFVRTEQNEWEKVKIGTGIFAGDELKTSASGYVALLFAKSKLVELKHIQPKTYKFEELVDLVPKLEQGLATQFLNYLLSKMAPESREANRNTYIQLIAATERGHEEIALFIDTNANLYSSNAVIRWDPSKNAGGYVVTLKHIFEDVIRIFDTEKPYFELDFNDEAIKGKSIVIINVSLKNDIETASGDYAIQRIDETDAEISSKLKELESVLDPESPFSHLIIAEFFEQNELLLDALTRYEYAIRQNPGVDYFNDAYLEFLMRNKYTDKID